MSKNVNFFEDVVHVFFLSFIKYSIELFFIKKGILYIKGHIKNLLFIYDCWIFSNKDRILCGFVKTKEFNFISVIGTKPVITTKDGLKINK